MACLPSRLVRGVVKGTIGWCLVLRYAAFHGLDATFWNQDAGPSIPQDDRALRYLRAARASLAGAARTPGAVGALPLPLRSGAAGRASPARAGAPAPACGLRRSRPS